MQELVRANSGVRDEAHETVQLVLSGVGTKSTMRGRVEGGNEDEADRDEDGGWLVTSAERSSSEKRYCTRGCMVVPVVVFVRSVKKGSSGGGGSGGGFVISSVCCCCVDVCSVDVCVDACRCIATSTSGGKGSCSSADIAKVGIMYI